MDGEIVVRLLNTIVLAGVVMVGWLLFEPIWKGVTRMMTQAEWDAEFSPDFKHVGIPMDCVSCETMVGKHKFTWLECTQAHWRAVTNRVQAIKALPPARIPDTVSLVAAHKPDLMEIGFRSRYDWTQKPEKAAEVFRVKKKDITNNSDGAGNLGGE